MHSPLRLKHRLLSSLLAYRGQHNPWQVSRTHPAQYFRMGVHEHTSPCSAGLEHDSCRPMPSTSTSGRRVTSADLGGYRRKTEQRMGRERSELTHRHKAPPTCHVCRQRTPTPPLNHRQHSKTTQPSVLHQWVDVSVSGRSGQRFQTHAEPKVHENRGTRHLDVA